LEYDDLISVVNVSYLETNDIRKTMKDTGASFDEVFECLGFKDWFDWIETGDD
jgi:hypothetical protein